MDELASTRETPTIPLVMRLRLWESQWESSLTHDESRDSDGTRHSHSTSPGTHTVGVTSPTGVPGLVLMERLARSSRNRWTAVMRSYHGKLTIAQETVKHINLSYAHMRLSSTSCIQVSHRMGSVARLCMHEHIMHTSCIRVYEHTRIPSAYVHMRLSI